MNLLVTAPSVAYHLYRKSDPETALLLKSPQDFPDPSHILRIEEPMMQVDVVTPKEYIGTIMNLVQNKRGIYQNTEYLNENTGLLHYTMPMSSILTDFYDKLKSVSSGYASLNYDFVGYKPAEVVKMDILVAEDPVEC